jgi:hypothetical protein
LPDTFTTAVRLAPRRSLSAVAAVGMASIFRAAWWPIHVAVAWALTRDREFVERSSRDAKSLRSLTILLSADKVLHGARELYFEGVSSAWSALSKEIAAGSIRARGTSFRGETTGEVCTIPAKEIASLRLQDDGRYQDCLAHGSSRMKNLWGYRDVQIFQEEVLCVFPAEGTTREEGGASFDQQSTSSEAPAPSDASAQPGEATPATAELIAVPAITPPPWQQPGDSKEDARTRWFLYCFMQRYPAGREYRKRKGRMTKADFWCHCEKRCGSSRRRFDVIWDWCVDTTGATDYRKGGPRGPHA